MESDRADPPEDALATVAQARAAAADRLVTPWWYHPILGFLLGGYVVAFSFGDTVVRAVAFVVFAIGVGVLVRAYTRLTGVWISGFEAGRASRWTWAMCAVIAAGVAVSVTVVQTTAAVWPTWCIAVLLFVAIVVLGHRFDAELRSELRRGA